MLPALDSLDEAFEEDDVLAVFNHSSEVLLGCGKVYPSRSWKMPRDVFVLTKKTKKQKKQCL